MHGCSVAQACVLYSMKPSSVTSISDDPRDLAASWFAYMHSGEVTEEGRCEFERWYQADPENRRQYRNVQQIWSATLQIPEGELRSILARQNPVLQPAANVGRRRFSLGVGVAGACSLGVLGSLGFQWLTQASPIHVNRITSLRGERRGVVLPDGTTLLINTGTLAEARLYEDRRIIDLEEGEIYFSVSHDAQRPFIVNAADSRIVVTGTQFNVRHERGHMQVSVASGSVSVSRGPWWNRESRALTRGQAVESEVAQMLGEVHSTDLSKRLAWQRGKVVFENTPLRQAIEEINRYLPKPARLDAPSLQDYRIAGIFSVDDPLALIDTLPDFAPVRVFHLPDGQVRISDR